MELQEYLADSVKRIHAHGAFLLHQKPLVHAVYMKVVLAGCEDFNRIVSTECLLADNTDFLAESTTGLFGARRLI